MIAYPERRLTLEHRPGYGSVRATVTVFYYLIKRDPAFSLGVRARVAAGAGSGRECEGRCFQLLKMFLFAMFVYFYFYFAVL